MIGILITIIAIKMSIVVQLVSIRKALGWFQVLKVDWFVPRYLNIAFCSYMLIIINRKMCKKLKI